MSKDVARHRTAIARGGALSRPVRTAIAAGLLTTDDNFFDYGCGRGEDINILKRIGYRCNGWDPTHRPDTAHSPASVVNLGFVINVIENPAERQEAMQSAWNLAERVLVVAARSPMDSRRLTGEEFGDGCLTSASTFQKQYSQTELRDWIQLSLNVDPVAAAPGVFFVFRDELKRQEYLARRYRRRRSAPKITKSERLFEEHRELAEDLMDFITDHGRLPSEWEFERFADIGDAFGSIKRAFAVIRRITGQDQWAVIREDRMGELLMQFALQRFTKRPRFSELPPDIQLDVREFFSSYKNACEQADQLLFQAGDMDAIDSAMTASPVGKRTGNALYVHVDALHELPLLLRVYEGCAKAYIGDIVEANILKLHRQSPRVSYLQYPEFDTDPHPALAESFLVKMGGLRVSYRSYHDSLNPPILHRKEEFVSRDDDRWAPFHKLTAQEERWGLYEHPEHIGTSKGWQDTLDACGAAFRGRRLVKVKPALPPTGDSSPNPL